MILFRHTIEVHYDGGEELSEEEHGALMDDVQSDLYIKLDSILRQIAMEHGVRFEEGL